MRFFKFFVDENIRGGLSCDEDEWRYRFRPLGKFAVASLRTPAAKSGKSGKAFVNIERSHVHFFGLLRANGTFSGIMLFDPLWRLFVFLVCLGIGGSRGSVLGGVIAGFIFYLLASIFSMRDEALCLAALRKRLRR